jgi:signal transduction histidine kinase
MLKKQKLGTQFTLLLTLVFLGGVILSGITLSSALQSQAEEDITMRAKLLTQTMDSVRAYTSSHIEPILNPKLNILPEFINEAVPAFSARKVFEQFRNNPEFNDFQYKEATLNPTNPQDRADPFETQLVETFRQQPSLKELSGYRSAAGQQLFYIAKPLSVSKPSCLVCHSLPESAPKSMIAAYGTEGGFGWRLNEVVAAQTIYVPADEILAHTHQAWVLIMSIFTMVFTAAVVLINGLLNQKVIHPIKQLIQITKRVGTGSMTSEHLNAFDAPNLVKVTRREDEPGQLARAFQDMAHEVTKREQNLSQAVEERTAQLAESTKEAEDARARAEDANKIKSQFLSNMSHELRTPLNIILGFTQLITKKGTLSSQQQKYLGTINRSGEHLLALINDVLDISKIETGKTTLHESNFDLYQLLDGLYQMFQLKAETKGLNLTFDLNINPPYSIYADESKLRQVLMNLLSNAIKFTNKGGVTLRVKQVFKHHLDSAAPQILFEVEDTGLGISSVELKQLFEPFVQTEAGINAHEGTGLGLSISQHFVHLMGGELKVQSQVGQGTLFEFELQFKVREEYQTQNSILTRDVIALASGQPTYKILIAEDKPENRELLLELLIPVGFEVKEACNGLEAISIQKNWSPHLILMDMRMPVMDGYEATQKIKTNITNSVSIIALTGGCN